MIYLAITKIFKVKNRLDHVLDYVSRSDATKHKEFVSAYNCSSVDPFITMISLKKSFHDHSDIVAYHAIQSFVPGEGTPELIHEIGKLTAKEMFGDKYQFVVCTHLDKDYLHNHIVMNPVSIIDGKRYHNSKKDIYHFRKISDFICKQYGLEVIENPKEKGKSRSQYHSAKNYIREIKKDIDDICTRAWNETEFYNEMKLKGYEFEKIEDIICILHPNYSKPIPLTLLGNKYSTDSIRKRILNQEMEPVKFKLAYKKDDVPYIYRLYKQHKIHVFLYEVVKFQVLLGILPDHKAKKQNLSNEIRKDCRKLDLISQATILMVKNDIQTIEELEYLKNQYTNKLNELLKFRKCLNTKAYREPDLIQKAKLKQQAKNLTPDIKKYRANIKSVEYIYARSEKIIEHNREMKSKEFCR